jgi:very-short-patch-repair endonuclease
MCGLILDFARTKYRLAIEADGSQHVDSPADARQTHILAQHGGAVLRLWNNDIPWRTEAVTEAILAASGKRPLTRSRAMPAITLSRTAGEG